MLCQFSVSNYRSYRDEVVLSMQAASMREFESSLIGSEDGQRFLPVSAVYGPNAGGKSNLLEAIRYVRDLVASPILYFQRGVGSGSHAANRVDCSPFVFDEVSREMPTSFELYYRVGDCEYRYDLEVEKGCIVGEALHRRMIGASRTAHLFTRDDDSIVLGNMLSKERVPTEFNRSIPYLSFLRMNSNYEAIVNAADWFCNCLCLDFNYGGTEALLEDRLSEAESNQVSNFLKAMGISISGIRVDSSGDESLRRKVYVAHEYGNRVYELPFEAESAGTRKLIGLAIPLMDAIHRGSLVVADELDSKLHPKLIKHLIRLFKDKKYNPNGSQLIFTTQDVSNMRNDVFRRDEVLFVDRGADGSSELWSLADMREPNGNPVNAKAAFDKQYLTGRYGAEPMIYDLTF